MQKSGFVKLCPIFGPGGLSPTPNIPEFECYVLWYFLAYLALYNVSACVFTCIFQYVSYETEKSILVIPFESKRSVFNLKYLKRWRGIWYLTLTRRQAWADDRSKMLQNVQQNVNILEFRYDIWNHCQKCILISTNMPSIGSVILEIFFEILSFFLCVWKMCLHG